VDTGKYGGIKAASFRRLSPFPAWSAESWIRDPARSGGAALDLHIHDTDFVNYLFGRPLSVRSFGTGQLPNGIDHIITHYKYGDDKMVTAEGGWMGMPEFPFRMEFTVMCSRASVEFSGKGVSVYTEEGETIKEETSQGNGWTREIDYFITCIAEGQALETVTPSSAREAVEIVCAEMESVRTEREVAL
jgi:predicted dehydrogenase